ncbi:hypothetical protein AK830_g2576 [Neonectria ditissima]|uniref:Uncharacterized protein n=1 Tax=Neonectria ditissima TaxID=78410 RepID=A0A0P7BTK2_9HYPO|nr:hypothetical protein AK830_g2576 [Neonectria ditissima]
MKLSTLLLFPAIYVSAVAAADKACPAKDRCQRGVDGRAGEPPLSSRLSDCKALNTITVSPYTITSTTYTGTVAVQIPTGLPVKRRSLNDLAARAVAAGPTATTINPTVVPSYATYCDSPSAYYSACSRAGATPAVTTLSTATTTTTITTEICPVRSIAKRAGEAVGYEYEDGWDSYNMPAFKLF